MAFDILSFLAGVAAGVITGALAGVLHGLESTADLQDRLRGVTKEAESIKSRLLPSDDSDSPEKQRLDELHRDLEEIHEEIRRMYRRTTH